MLLNLLLLLLGVGAFALMVLVLREQNRIEHGVRRLEQYAALERRPHQETREHTQFSPEAELLSGPFLLHRTRRIIRRFTRPVDGGDRDER